MHTTPLGVFGCLSNAGTLSSKDAPIIALAGLMGRLPTVANLALMCHNGAMRVGAFELQEPIPDLKDPHVIAGLRPWLDAGNVGTVALTRLEQHFSSKELGKLVRPGVFFDLTRYRPITRIVEGHRSMTIPNTTVHVAIREKGPDFLFLQLLEPHAFAEDYVESFVELLKMLKVKRYCRIGGMFDAVPHTRPLLVTGSLGSQPLQGVAGVVTRRPGGNYEGPTSVMGLISDSLEGLGVENMSLMVHLPQYLEIEDDYMGAGRLLEVLCALYDLSSTLPTTEQGRRQYRQVSAQVQNNAAVKALVERLEAYYDATAASSAEESPPLAPQVERFLKEMGRQLEGPST